MVEVKEVAGKPVIDKKVINVKDVYVKDGIITDDNGTNVMAEIAEALKDDGIFSFRISVALPE